MAAQSTEFINSLSFLKPTPERPEGLILSAGKETIIDVRPPTANPDNNAYRLLVGHAHNICTIDVAPSGKWIISGGWDGQARVWASGRWETDLVLSGHDNMSVWAVLAFNDSTVITGCADKNIRIFDLKKARAGEANAISRIITPDIVRALCKLPVDHPSGASFASAGNDGIVRFWKMNGKQAAELHGHESFIYSLALLPSGELVSSGEDRTVRIWKGTECIQTITLPAISVWAVATCEESGDIVAGSSDGVARIFSRSLERKADRETLKQFDDAIKSSSIPQQQVGDINKEKLPGPEFLQARSGTKEGQVQMIKEHSGSVSAYTWSTSEYIYLLIYISACILTCTLPGQQTWVNVGTVVDSAASTGRKVEYKGQMYDFVFDVAIEEGAPSLKLPYNLSENPYDRATKFINDNELSVNYLDQIAQFITQNTQGATIGQSQQLTSADPLGTESRYIPGQNNSSAPRTLPHREYLFILAAKYEAIFKKIFSLNSSYKLSGRKEISLSPSEETSVASLHDMLKVGAMVEDMVSVSFVIRCLENWPYSDRIALLDLLRCLAASPAVASYVDDDEGSIVDIALRRSFYDTEGQPNENMVMLALRVAANIFKTEEGRLVASSSVESVIQALEMVIGMTGEPIGKSNRNVLIAASTLCINYSVLSVQEEESGMSPKLIQRLVAVLMALVKEQTDSEVVFRALVGLGTLVAAKKQSMSGTRDAVHTALGKINEPRVKSVGNEILGMLP